MKLEAQASYDTDVHYPLPRSLIQVRTADRDYWTLCILHTNILLYLFQFYVLYEKQKMQGLLEEKTLS